MSIDAKSLLKQVLDLHDCKHFEVETYAWTVLPDELKTEDLARGIAKELLWVQEKLEELASSDQPADETISLHT